jgi:hypothetical protein
VRAAREPVASEHQTASGPLTGSQPSLIRRIRNLRDRLDASSAERTGHRPAPPPRGYRLGRAADANDLAVEGHLIVVLAMWFSLCFADAAGAGTTAVLWIGICAGAESLRTRRHRQKRKAACVATSGPSLGRKRPRRAAIAGGRYGIPYLRRSRSAAQLNAGSHRASKGATERYESLRRASYKPTASTIGQNQTCRR